MKDAAGRFVQGAESRRVDRRVEEVPFERRDTQAVQHVENLGEPIAPERGDRDPGGIHAACRVGGTRVLVRQVRLDGALIPRDRCEPRAGEVLDVSRRVRRLTEECRLRRRGRILGGQREPVPVPRAAIHRTEHAPRPGGVQRQRRRTQQRAAGIAVRRRVVTDERARRRSLQPAHAVGGEFRHHIGPSPCHPVLGVRRP